MSFDNLWRDFKYKVNAFIRLNVGERQKIYPSTQLFTPNICVYYIYYISLHYKSK